MAQRVELPSKTFTSKKSAKEYCRQIHNELYSIGEVVSSPEHDAVLRDLVIRHPRADEKIGPGVKEFFIGLTSDGDRQFVKAGQTGIWVRDVEGGVIDFSYNTAIDQPDERAVVKEALRSAVEDLRIVFRERAFESGASIVCPITGHILTSWEQAAVVYREPSWAELTAGFAEAKGGWGEIKTSGGSGEVQIGYKLSDNQVRDDWIAYWTRNARPLIVSKEHRSG